MQEEESTTQTSEQMSGQSAVNNNQRAPGATPEHNDVLVSWSASEYIAHHKNKTWFIMLGVIVAVVSVVIFLLTSDLVSSIVVAIAGIIFGIFATRKPEVRTYELMPSGLVISDKLFPYEMFISFAIHEEGALKSIFLMPAKRFMPGITVYYPPEQEDKIIEALSNYLPLEERGPDIIDRLMSRVRF